MELVTTLLTQYHSQLNLPEAAPVNIAPTMILMTLMQGQKLPIISVAAVGSVAVIGVIIVAFLWFKKRV